MPFDFSQMMQDPMSQMALGILGANKPGATFGQAVGGGIGAGLQNLQQMQLLKEQSATRAIQTEMYKQQLADAKRKAAQQMKFQEALAGYQVPEGTDPALAGLIPLALQSGDIGSVLSAVKPPKPAAAPASYQEWLLAGSPGTFASWVKDKDAPVDPMSYREWQLAGSPGSYADWVQRGKALLGGTDLRPKVTAGLQEQAIAAGTVIPAIDRLISETQALPAGIGGIAEAREGTAGIAGQLADVGVPGMRALADFIKPEVTLLDPSAPGGQRKITGQTLKTQSEALTIKLKPLMADSGPLSNQDRVRLSTALGDVATADSERRLEALSTIRDIISANAETVTGYLQSAGAGVPSATPPPPMPGQTQDGYQFMGGDPSNPASWKKL